MGTYVKTPTSPVKPETVTVSPVCETIKQSSPNEHVSAWESNSARQWMCEAPGSVAASLFLFL